ncbi:MAG: anhydro-N-acetylmuramic acid kinase [Bacteroidetes bacterium]|nr:anhydro-N-acetylmuramic acid kinase [Bacteroidota bacterium]MBU2585680.1 anhydro-N-acetylmuramic acid kinase [Bacteroidota bacterium]
MRKLIKLSKKRKKLVIGLMSGTSLDGIDASLVEIENSGVRTKFKELYFKSYPYPQKLRDIILENSLQDRGTVNQICELNMLIGKLYAKAVENICREYGIEVSDIDLIGSHGQTIHHLPKAKRMFGSEVRATLQIGDPSVISKLTGVITVGDFRTGDMALGGQGAPLVPYFDYITFRSNRTNRALLNIGGISNITLLKKKCKLEDVIAFDTGPGNMMIDYLMKKLFRRKFDKDGKTAFRGDVNRKLFDKLIRLDKFLDAEPPKSTGREYYNQKFIDKVLNGIADLKKVDIIRTFSEFTSYAIFYNYQKFLRQECEITEMLVSGGGANNKYLITSLQHYFGNRVRVKTVDGKLMSSDSKEALCFAILANETISGNAANIPRVTGASAATVLGKICP